MRIVALLATYNERRFVGGCIEHLCEHGVDVYLIDNQSTDETMEIASRYEGKGLIGCETLPRRNDMFSLRTQLKRKQELARELEADWFIHLDADELRLPPPGYRTLSDALVEVDSQGFDVVNFLEFSFLPTREEPDHDHRDFRRTLGTYYPYLPRFPHRLNAWKAKPEINLTVTGGHRVLARNQHPYPESFRMKHYLFLSLPHAIEKYAERRFDPEDLRSGYHGVRSGLTSESIRLPSRSKLRFARRDEDLDASAPRRSHLFSGG